MRKFVLFILFLVIFLNRVDANGEEQINWLKNQQNAVTGLVDSYEGDGQNYAYTYDQALATIAFTQAGEIDRAKKLLDRIKALQLSNGAWYQCYNTANENLGHSGCNYYPTGDISWIVMAINFYEVNTGDKSYSQMALKALNWLDTVRNTNPSEEIYGSLDLCRGTACTYPNAISTENNYDAYSAYYYKGILEKDHSLIEKANLIKNYLIKEMWAPSAESNGPYHNVGVFWVGYNNFGWYTDPQSWGVLALGPYGLNGENFTRALEWLYTYGYGYGSTRHNQTYNPEIDGFDFWTKPIKNSTWLEGTEGVAAAYYSISDSEKGDYFHSQTEKVIAPNGGIIYSFSAANPSNIIFPDNFRYNSVASTAWYYFNEKRINPFKLDIFIISLQKGWNLISFPLNLKNKSIKDVFKNINFKSIFSYGSWYYYFNETNNNFNLINESKGYWINSLVNQTLIIKGTKFNPININLNNNWNLVGYPYLEEKNISKIFENVTVYLYNNSNWYSYGSKKPSYLNTLNKFTPGYGYWVKKIL